MPQGMHSFDSTSYLSLDPQISLTLISYPALSFVKTLFSLVAINIFPEFSWSCLALIALSS